jgi:hypothetical protein
MLRPDQDHQRKEIIPRLQEKPHETVVLCKHCPKKRTVPAIWLCCLVSRKIDKVDMRAMESAPWYHRFGGDRINDCHLLLEEKRTARETKAREGSSI